MAWRRDVIGDIHFPSKMFGEDVDWVDAVCAKATTEMQMQCEPLYYYNFNEATTSTR